MKSSESVNKSPTGNQDTGLPLFHSWKGVYLFVLASFVLWVALLILLTRMYS